MSNKEQDRVWEYSRQKGIGLVVMLAIANRADDDGICWPGQKDLAKRARVSRRSIQRFIDSAASDREVAIVERPGKSHLYVVLVGLPEDEQNRRLGLVAINKTDGESAVEPAPGSHPDLRQPDAPPAPARRTTCASQSIPGAQVYAQIGQPGAQVYAQSGRRTIIEPSVESSMTEYNIYDLYLSVFGEPPISKEHDLLGELAEVYPRDDMLRVAKITKERDKRKRILYKVGYMQGVLWGEARKNGSLPEDDDDDVVPWIGFGRTLIDYSKERPRSNA